MHVWIVNPFDELPNETDVPLRYWSLCRTFAELGHDVVWWSSNFSHLRKVKRQKFFNTSQFSIRLINTPPYKKNISFARLKNHRIFAKGFHDEAVDEIQSGRLEAPDRIVVSLSPLGIAESAFRIRKLAKSRTHKDCQVILDVIDAWPETFHRIFPKSLRKRLGPVLFASFHHSARRAYEGADKISAVGQSYLELAKSYLDYENSNTLLTSWLKPMHLCYHGTDLNRFRLTKEHEKFKNRLNKPLPLKAVYLGAMGSGYDLMTIVKVAAQWKTEGRFPWQIHFAGTGPLAGKLQRESKRLGLSTEFKKQNKSISTNTHKDSDRVVFHGLLKQKAVNKLLLSADIALVPNRPDSLVICPNKASEYAAAGLPILSCLKGEFETLLKKWDAGAMYRENEPSSLNSVFEKYLTNLNFLREQGINARNLAESLFDRANTYPLFAKFIVD